MMMGQQDTVGRRRLSRSPYGSRIRAGEYHQCPDFAGDLLTTSDMPGYAMKVTDYDRANGAIIGKAMTGLPAGDKGLVLVLVSLQ